MLNYLQVLSAFILILSNQTVFSRMVPIDKDKGLQKFSNIKALCKGNSSEAQEGSFSVGYRVIFEHSNDDVIVTFELLDTDKSGIVAFLREETPFSEVQMDQVSEKVFTKTLTDRMIGDDLRLACKFAFEGGLAVSKYFDYKVGEDCSGTEDVTPPVNFTATLGEVTFNSAEFILNGMDESNKVIFRTEYDTNIDPLSIDDGEEGILIINGLNAETDYTFSITASDLAGNYAENGPIVLLVKTLESTNTACEGNDFVSQLGEFEIGYNYSFETDGTDVIMTFELLDDKEGVFAFLWQESPFTESRLDNTSGKIYSARIPDQEIGSTIRYACKFEFQGGLAVTKYFSYVV
ncbi:MAG: hypothetical protein AB8B73_13295, partial [Ekhidna sp.]